MKPGAAAIFVKSPGHSALKTRLAKGIGQAQALRFYKHSCRSVSATLTSVSQLPKIDLKIHWAVAETEALNLSPWKQHPNIWQGSGQLGDRLHRVYQELIQDHSYVLFFGGDCPQFSRESVQAGINKLSNGADFVFGPAGDGGFWLFGGKKAIPKSIWTGTEYSQPDTCRKLSSELQKIGNVDSLMTYQDVDTEEDLRIMRGELLDQQYISSAQGELIRSCLIRCAGSAQ